MSNVDELPQSPPSRRRKRRALVLLLLLLMMLLILAGWHARDDHASPAVPGLSTATASSTAVEPQPSATATATATASRPVPTRTATATPRLPTATPSATPSATATARVARAGLPAASSTPRSATATSTSRPSIALPVIGLFAVQNAPDGTALIVWHTHGAETVLLDGQRIAPDGAAPASDGGTYVLRASNRAGAVQARLTLPRHNAGGKILSEQSPGQALARPTATPGITLPRIVLFSVVRADGRTQVAWQVRGADQVLLGGAAVAANGTRAAPAGGTLRLIARNRAGQVSRDLSMPSPATSPTATSATPHASSTPTAAPGRTPRPTATATITPRPSATSAPHPSATGMPSFTPIPTATGSPTPRPGAQPRPAASSTPSPRRPSAPAPASPRPSSTETATATSTATPAASRRASPVPTWTRTPAVPSATRTVTAMQAATATRTATATARVSVATSTPTATAAPAPPAATSTATATVPPATATPTSTTPPSHTPTSTPSSTATTVPSNTPTTIPTNTPTNTATSTPTDTATATPTDTPVPQARLDPPGATLSRGLATFTLTNQGPGPLSVSGASLAGPDTGAFAISGDTCSGATVAPNQTCTLGVGFDPKTAVPGDSTGAYHATLTVQDNAGNGPQTADLSAGPRTATLSPTSATLTYGSSTTFTLTNNGPGPLSLSSVGVNPGFSTSPDKMGFGFDPLGGCGALPTLGVGASCILSVQAQDNGPACTTVSGALTIAADASNAPFTASLTGRCQVIG